MRIRSTGRGKSHEPDRDTWYLRGYAAQIDANRTGALTTLETYGETYCGNTSGLDGLLTTARWVVDSTTHSFLRLMANGGQGLYVTAYDLRKTAHDYDHQDAANADEIWTTGQGWTPPQGYQEHDVAVVSSGFSHGATINLAIPSEHHDAQQAKASVISSLGTVNRLIRWFTGTDLLAEPSLNGPDRPKAAHAVRVWSRIMSILTAF